MTSMYKHTCRHTHLGKFLRHKHATPNAIYLRCLLNYIQYILKLFRIKTWKALGIFVHQFVSRLLVFLRFCSVTKAYYHPYEFFVMTLSCHVQVRKSNWSDICPHLSKSLALRAQVVSVCYGRRTFRKKRSKESLKDKPCCAHKWRAGLLSIPYFLVGREAIGVFCFRISAFLQVMKHKEKAIRARMDSQAMLGEGRLRF